MSDTTKIEKITGQDGKEYTIVPDGYTAVPTDQLNELMEQHKILRNNFKILNNDMGVAVRANIHFMGLLKGKLNMQNVIKLTRKLLVNPEESRHTMAPIDYIVGKYSIPTDENAKDFESIPFEQTFEQWKKEHGITE